MLALSAFLKPSTWAWVGVGVLLLGLGVQTIRVDVLKKDVTVAQSQAKLYANDLAIQNKAVGDLATAAKALTATNALRVDNAVLEAQAAGASLSKRVALIQALPHPAKGICQDQAILDMVHRSVR
jgi:hypothetical protein